MKDIIEFEKENKKVLDNFTDWIIFRNKYNSFFLNKKLKLINNSIIKINNRNIIERLKKNFNKICNYFKTIFYGFNNWFYKYEYIIISDSSQRKLIENKYSNKLFKEIIEYLGQDKTLMIEVPINKHFNINQIDNKYIVSFNVIKSIAKTLSIITKLYVRKKFFRQNSTVKSFFITNFSNNQINTILNHYNYMKKIENIFDILFSLYKIKVLFLSCYYGKESIIRSAKKRGIKVIEMQHGIIGKNHYAYNSVVKLDENSVPDILFSFGYEGGYEEFIIKKVFPIGNYYIEYINNNFYIDIKLNQIIKNYKYSFSVSLQNTCEIELINFIKNIAKKHEDYLFILIPRNYSKNFNMMELSSNIIFYPELDFYSITKHCNFHITIYSTTALEAPSLGIPNILYNHLNLSNIHYNYLTYLDHTVIINDENDFENAVNKLKIFKKDEIILKNKSIFINNYKENLRNAFNELINFNIFKYNI